MRSPPSNVQLVELARVPGASAGARQQRVSVALARRGSRPKAAPKAPAPRRTYAGPRALPRSAAPAAVVVDDEGLAKLDAAIEALS